MRQSFGRDLRAEYTVDEVCGEIGELCLEENGVSFIRALRQINSVDLLELFRTCV